MKRLFCVIAAVALSLPVLGSAAMDHGSMGGMDHGSMGKGQAKGDAKPVQRKGKKIREVKLDGYKLEYYFMDMKEMMQGMPMKDTDMSKMKSHHVMVYITRPDGKPVEDAKVGYKIDGPGGEQKTMAGPMTGGQGADADFKGKGTYKFTMKAVVEEKSLLDNFNYEVK